MKKSILIELGGHLGMFKRGMGPENGEAGEILIWRDFMDKRSWDLFRLKSIHSNKSFLTQFCFLFTPHIPFHFLLCSYSEEIAKTPLIVVSW